jgi:hypothetical protein
VGSGLWEDWKMKPNRWNVAMRAGGVALFLGLIGCATQHPVPLKTQEELLSFLEDGKSAKEGVILKLGQPTGQFEGEKILTYRMTLTEEEGLVATRPAGQGGWQLARYSLVLVFDDAHILQKHNLVQVR